MKNQPVCSKATGLLIVLGMQETSTSLIGTHWKCIQVHLIIATKTESDYFSNLWRKTKSMVKSNATRTRQANEFKLLRSFHIASISTLKLSSL